MSGMLTSWRVPTTTTALMQPTGSSTLHSYKQGQTCLLYGKRVTNVSDGIQTPVTYQA